MIVTNEHIKAIAPGIKDRVADVFVPFINQFSEEVNTPLRMAAFLAQVLHESGCFRWLEELASGKEYEGRKDLGNTEPGDGARFKGRGLIQITGRFNYEKVSVALYDDAHVLLSYPEMLAQPGDAVRSAYWFWNEHKLNELADAKDFERITRRINGGLNGEAERLAYYTKSLEIFTV